MYSVRITINIYRTGANGLFSVQVIIKVYRTEANRLNSVRITIHINRIITNKLSSVQIAIHNRAVLIENERNYPHTPPASFNVCAPLCSDNVNNCTGLPATAIKWFFLCKCLFVCLLMLCAVLEECTLDILDVNNRCRCLFRKVCCDCVNILCLVGW